MALIIACQLGRIASEGRSGWTMTGGVFSWQCLGPVVLLQSILSATWSVDVNVDYRIHLFAFYAIRVKVEIYAEKFLMPNASLATAWFKKNSNEVSLLKRPSRISDFNTFCCQICWNNTLSFVFGYYDQKRQHVWDNV